MGMAKPYNYDDLVKDREQRTFDDVMAAAGWRQERDKFEGLISWYNPETGRRVSHADAFMVWQVAGIVAVPDHLWEENRMNDEKQENEKIVTLVHRRMERAAANALIAFAFAHELDDDEILGLARLSFRGLPPMSTDGWRLVREAIVSAVGDDWAKGSGG